MNRGAAAVTKEDVMDDDIPFENFDGEKDGDGEKEEPKKADADPNKPKRAVNRKPRPKLTVDILKEEKGIPTVFNTFSHVFRQQFRGKGHEVGDLKRLLEMYVRWQKSIFPHCEFHEFVQRLEKLGTTNTLKVELRMLRQGLLDVVDPQPKHRSASPGPHGGHTPAAAKQQEPPAAPASPASEPDYDAYMEAGLEEQMDAAMEAVPEAFDDNFQATAPRPAVSTATAISHIISPPQTGTHHTRRDQRQDDDNDEEQLLRELEAAAGGNGDDDDDDDDAELLALVAEQRAQVDAQNSSRGQADADVAQRLGGRGSGPSNGGVDDELEDLLDDIGPRDTQGGTQEEVLPSQVQRSRTARNVLLEDEDDD